MAKAEAVRKLGSSLAAVTVLLAPTLAFAYHDNLGQHSSFDWDLIVEVIVPVAVVVVVAMVGLGLWGRKKPKTKAKRRKRKARR